MSTSQNGYPVLGAGQVRKWIIPGTNRHLVLAPGPAGFILVHLALWYHEKIERLDLGTWDEWGWAVRPIRGSTTTSNHASGTACDLNATRHPLGTKPAKTLTRKQRRAIRRRRRLVYPVVRWGGDYQTRPDPMHYEINSTKTAVRALAKVLRATPRGRRITKAN